MTRTALGLRTGDCLTCFDGYLATGETGMHRDGSPIVCTDCGGTGRDLLTAGLEAPLPLQDDTR